MDRIEDYSLVKWMDFESELTKEKTEKWFGTYRGIRYEIKRFDALTFSGNAFSWCHYIYISVDEQLDKSLADEFWLTPEYIKFSETSKERLSYKYYESVVNKLEFHGGCTWYSKETKIDEPVRVVKIGCDYQHIWDDHKNYDIDYVYSEVKKTIDSLWKLANERIKIRSSGDGVYRFIHEFKQ